MTQQAEETEVQIEQTEAEVPPVAEVAEGETPNATEAPAAEAEADEVVVSIGEESPPSEEEEIQRAPEWVRKLRKEHRELQREKRELEQKLQAAAPQPQKTVVGEKPTLEGCDYDAELFEQQLTAWQDRKRAAEADAKRIEDEQKAAQTAWQARLDSYGKAKSELRVKDYEDAEEVVLASLNVVQQGVILQGAENPALLVYALGKNPKKAAELASVTDPVKFAFAVAKLEKDLKVTPRKAPPPPEQTVRGTAPVSGAVGSARLDELRAKAQKSGDYTEYLAYKRSLKAA